MAYCTGCRDQICCAFFGCLGLTPDKYQLLELGNETILLFKCDVCKKKDSLEKEESAKIDYSCVCCQKTDGLLFEIKGTNRFVHFICAITLQEHFKVTSSLEISFRKKQEDEQMISTDKYCDICGATDSRYLLECQGSKLDATKPVKRAHAYCIMQKRDAIKRGRNPSKKLSTEWNILCNGLEDGTLSF